VVEPGLDLHDWETRWQQLQELAADDSREALGEIVRLVRQMLEERKYDLENPVVVAGEDPDVVRDFLAAADIARRIDAGLEVESDDVQTALDDLREIYELITIDRAAP
jgi:hypothetical protein